MEITNLNYSPNLKNLLVNYVQLMYEQDAIITDDYLITEYQMLKNENRLDELLQQELFLTGII